MPSITAGALLSHREFIRLGFFLGIFALMAVWEFLAPRRRLQRSKTTRWINNIGIVTLNTVIARLVFPAAAVAVALFAQSRGLGLLNFAQLPYVPAVVIAVIALDLVIYVQHVLMHAIPLLWRMHRVHHADLDIDVTTGARFHPLEILLSLLIKFAAIVLLGAPAVAVVIFEVLLNGTSMFNHANVRLYPALDRLLRLLVVTPDMHRVHHSVNEDETNSNFGFNLPWWDRLFGTYRAEPRAGHEAMTIGITTFRQGRLCTWLPGMLFIPFVGRVTEYALNRRS